MSAALPSGQRGFSLAELAIAFVIIALLLAGSFIPLTVQVEVKNISETRRSMDQVREALIGFAQSNGRLPCPASATAVSGSSTAGVEQYAANVCTSYSGVVPWSTLGLTETDAWGRRFTYRVSSVFSDAISQSTWSTTGQTSYSDCTTPSPTPTLATFALCSLGEIAVIMRSIDTSTSAHNTVALGTGLAAVVISHGKNGFGAYQPSGTQIAGGAAGTDEAANASGGTSGTPGSGNNYTSWLYYSRPQTAYTSPCSETANGSQLCEFDDIVSMIPAPTLIARMVNAGRLP